jgi:hypothetical protein
MSILLLLLYSILLYIVIKLKLGEQIGEITHFC